MIIDLPQFRTPDARKGLAGRTANNHVDCGVRRSETKLGDKCAWLHLRDIARLRVFRLARMKVSAVGGRRMAIKLNCPDDLEAGELEAHRKPAAPREQI